jgi:hypothetical protein
MPPMPFGEDDERIKVLIMTVNMLTKKIDELEERLRKLEWNKR